MISFRGAIEAQCNKYLYVCLCSFLEYVKSALKASISYCSVVERCDECNKSLPMTMCFSVIEVLV